MIHHGDALEVLRTFPADSIDALVTDPPAGISFMGKSWDHHKGGRDRWIEWMTEVMRECYRVMKPGAHALVWALPRTSHWTATAIEDAGFDVRDRLAHVFASGFPKSHNLPGGLGTALKPAMEDWWLARKPLVGSVAVNVTRYGTGAINIDACRISHASEADAAQHKANNEPWTRHGRGTGGVLEESKGMHTPGRVTPAKELPPGRWPSNLLLSDPELFDVANPGVVGSGAVTSSGAAGKKGSSGFVNGYDGEYDIPYGDSGGYSRFFRIPDYGESEVIEPPTREEWMTDRDWEEFQVWDRQVADLYGVRYSKAGGRSGMLSVCRICGAPIAESSSTERTPPPNTAPSSTATPPPEPSDPSASDAVSPSLSPETATAPRPAQMQLDGMLEPTASEDSRTRGSDTETTESGTGHDQRPATTSRSSRRAKAAAQPTTSTATTTTTAGPSMCGPCAERATSENIPPPGMGSSVAQPPVEQRDYPIAFCIPKADRADREPVLRGQLARADAKVAAANNPICESCGLSKYDRGGGVCECEDPQWRQQQRLARENAHPTVKPTDLMRHLVRLVTPPGGTVLDPFLGSGSTAIACELEGFPWIGIEKEAEYVAIAEARLNGVQRGLGLDVPAPTRKRTLMTESEAKERVKSYRGHATYSGGWGWETDPEEAA